MEETKRGEGTRASLQALSGDLSPNNQQLTTSTSFPRSVDTQYRACTGETYQPAHLPPPPLANSISEITDEVGGLIDLDSADLLDSDSSPQIDKPPGSDTSTDSDSSDELINSSTYIEPQQVFRPVVSRSQISLVPVYKGTSIPHRENTDHISATTVLNRLMEAAINSDDTERTALFAYLGVHNGYGTGPDFDGVDSKLHSKFQRKNLEIELNARSEPGSSGVYAYEMGFDVSLFCRKARAIWSSGSSTRHMWDVHKSGFCPYEVITTRKEFQHHINKMILLRKKAWNDICQQFDPPAAAIGIDPDFEALAAAFFGGLEVPEKPFLAPTKGAKSYKITRNTGDRVKALETNPLHNDELVVFLEDCMFCNQMEIAQRTGQKFSDLVVRKGPSYPGYRSIVAAEEEIKVLGQTTADNGLDSLEGQFLKAKLLKNLFDQVPQAVVDISQSEVPASQTDIDEVANLGIAKSQAQLNLESSSTGAAPTEDFALTDSGVIAAGEATQSKSKKKNKNKKKKKPVGQQKSAAEAPVMDGSTFDEPNVQEIVASLTIEELGSRDASVVEDEVEVPKAKIPQVIDQDSTSEFSPTVVIQTNGEAAANSVDGGQWQTIGKRKLKPKQSREDVPGEIANVSLPPGPWTQSNSLNNGFPSYKVAVPFRMKHSSANKTPQGKNFVEIKNSQSSSKRMNVTEQHAPIPMVTNIKCAKTIRSGVRHFDESECPAMPSKALNPTCQSHNRGAELQLQTQNAANLRVLPSASEDTNATEQHQPVYAATNAKTRLMKREATADAPKVSYDSSIVVHLSPNVVASQRSPSEVSSPSKAPTIKNTATRPTSKKRLNKSVRRNKKEQITAQHTYETEGTSVVASADRTSDIETEVEAETNASDTAQTPDTENVDFSSSRAPENGIEVADQSAHDNHTKKSSQILAAVDLDGSSSMGEKKPETSASSHLGELLAWADFSSPIKLPAGRRLSLTAEVNEDRRTSFHMPRSRSQETSSRWAQHHPQTSAGECRAAQSLGEAHDTRVSEIMVEHPASANQVPSTDFDTQIQNSRESSQNTDTSCEFTTIPYPHYKDVLVAYNGTPSHLGPGPHYGGFGLYNTQIPAQIFGNVSHQSIGLVDTHAHPTASNNFAVGNSFYHRPSQKHLGLEPVQRSSLDVLSCAFCQITINAKPQYPASLCPFCVGHGTAAYCSTACQLADSYDHCMSCQHCPSYNNASVSPPVPNALWRVENYPIQSSSYDPPSPECFRQKTFSMFCRTGQFPNLLGLWTLYKQFLPNKAHCIPDEKKHIGDYFIFRSAVTTGSPDHPSTDVICVISLDPRDAMKLCLRRLINACYVQPREPFVGALFRTLRYLLADDTVFNTMTCYSAYASQGEIIKEFMHQFSREFNFPADSQYPQQQFYFRREWDPIKSQMEEFERAHPILGYWKAKDIACQTFWTR